MSRVNLLTTSTGQQLMEEGAVHITLEEGGELPTRLDELERIFSNCYQENQFNIVLDLGKVKLPPTRFIVTLIKVTSQARRMGGDVRLINLNPSIRNNLVTFSPRTYLSIEPSEKYALDDFGETFYPHTEFDINENINILTSKAQANEVEQESVEEESHFDRQDNILKLLTLAQDRIRVQNKVENLYEICDFVLERAVKAGFDLRERGKIKVTIYEACLNVVEHAYFSNPDYWINVYVGYDKEKFIIIIQDWGESFEFDPSRPYDVEQAVKDRRTGGFGLHIIRRSVDEISYLTDPKDGNRLILVKYINAKNNHLVNT